MAKTMGASAKFLHHPQLVSNGVRLVLWSLVEEKRDNSFS